MAEYHAGTERKQHISRFLDALLAATIVPLLAAMAFGVWLAYKVYHPPYKPPRKRPESYGLPATSVKIPVANSRLHLDAWIILKPGASHTVIICHEWGSLKATKLHYAEFLHHAGYNIVLFDLRNHGESSPDHALGAMSTRYTEDLAAAVHYVRQRPECARGKVAILAFSFSTFPALYLVATAPHCPVHACVLDSGPTLDLHALSRRFMDTYGRLALPRLWRGPWLYSVLKGTFVRVTLAMLAVRWPVALAGGATPMLFIANADDQVAIPEDVQRLAAMYPGAEYWVAPETPHLLAFRLHRGLYEHRVTDFLARAFHSPAAPVAPQPCQSHEV